jgi:putative ABC transport system substrate-binding protein
MLDPGIPHHFAAFRKAMNGLGYVEGRSISYLYRSAEGKPERIDMLASEIVGLGPRVIVTAGPPSIRALNARTSTIPIVFAAVGDAVAAGVVTSIARPGGNATGLSFLNAELSAKRLDVLFEALPGLRRVAVLRDANTPAAWRDATDEASRARGVEPIVFEVRGPEDFDGVFESIAAARVDALDILSSALFNAQQEALVRLATQYRIATIYEHRDFVEAGGLLSYGPNIGELFRQAATYVDRILKGASPGGLPVEQPTKFELVISIGAARKLALTLPPNILARADEVIE